MPPCIVVFLQSGSGGGSPSRANRTPTQFPQSGMSDSRINTGESFVDPEDGFADDDLLSPSDSGMKSRTQPTHPFTFQVDASTMPGKKSYLERDNFADELGNHSADDPFGEDYSDIAKHGIVDVFSEGDLVGRFAHISCFGLAHIRYIPGQ